MSDLPWPLPDDWFVLDPGQPGSAYYNPAHPEVRRVAYMQALRRLLYSFRSPQEGERWWFDKPRMLWVCGVYPIPAAKVTFELVLTELGPKP